MQELNTRENPNAVLRRLGWRGILGSPILAIRGRGRWILPLRRVVHFVLQIKVLVGRENVRNVRHQLHLVPHERIRSAFLAGEGSAKAAEHDRAHLERRLAEVGDLHVRLERAHPTGLILADDKLQVVAAWSEYEARVVLYVLAADFLGAIHS